MGKYSVGVDFGTLSGRAVVADVSDGAVLASASMAYPHGVMDEALPWGHRLPQDWALQHPKDYLDVLVNVISRAVGESGVDPKDIIGVGTDFTACTVMPVTKDGIPLCFLPAYEKEPHAYVKLWKHHAAQDKADIISKKAADRGEAWLGRCGGKVSSEALYPKLWQMLDEAPNIYEAADYFVEAADWIVWQLTGNHTRNSCCAGYKAMYDKVSGYPSPDFFAELDPRLAHVAADKLGVPVTSIGEKAGEITEEMARQTGLMPGTTVSVGHIDAHVCMPAVGIDGPGKMLAIMGTSTCHIMLDTEDKSVPGLCGVVLDGIMPGYYGYEAGQGCVGDHFAWFVDTCCPGEYVREAAARGITLHQYLTTLAEGQRPGESGLLALDWWNGNRSVLIDADLTGMILGMTLQTKPEDIYRALIEATAYGTRMIIENYREHGVAVEEFYAAGGISQQNSMAMQIYADVINLPLRIADAAQGPALGSAIFGAVAAGKAAGGYDTVFEGARAMGKVKDVVYLPDSENVKAYDRLFAEYRRLHDYFGCEGNDVMKRLKAMKREYGK